MNKGRFIADGAVFDGDLCWHDWFVTPAGQFSRLTDDADGIVRRSLRWSVSYDELMGWLNIIEEKWTCCLI